MQNEKYKMINRYPAGPSSTHRSMITIPMKKHILTACFLLFITCSFAQRVDTALVLFNSKLNAIDFSDVLLDEEKLEKLSIILNDTLLFKAELLNSKGFKDFFFIKVATLHIGLADFLQYGATELKETNFDFSKYYYFEFILAYDIIGNRFYKLKGFTKNEFDLFYFEYGISARSWEHKNLRIKKQFIENYYVESLDLECLFEAIHNRKALTYHPFTSEFPCMQPNVIRLVLIR